MPSRGQLSRILALLVAMCAFAFGGACHLIFPYEGRDGGVSGEAGSDACLPIPASQVKGKYTGTWTGVYSCPNTNPWTVSGTLNLDMSPAAGGKSFQVSGEMNGVADRVYIIKGAVAGTMGCSSLSATMDRVSVTLYVFGLPITYFMKGQLLGTFNAPAGAGQGFKGGSWKASEIGGLCTASGTWSASGK